jgi:hypothetical protein
LRDEIERREILKHTHRIRRAEYCHGAGEANAGRARCGGSEDDRGRGVQEVLAVMLADSEDIESALIGVFDLLDEIPKALRGAQRPAAFVVRRREAVNANLNEPPPS